MQRRGNRFVAQWRDEHGERRTASVSIRLAGGEDAARRMAEAIQAKGRLHAYEIRKGLASADAIALARHSQRPLRGVIEEHLDEMRRKKRSPEHVQERARVLTTALGRLRSPSAITAAYARQWLHAGERRWSPTTFNAYRRHLFSFCRWCVRNQYLAANPIETIDSRDVLEPERAVRTFTREEAARLVAHPARGEFYELMLLTGLRWREVTRLRAEHWFAADETILMPATATKTKVEQLLPRPPARLLDRFAGTPPHLVVVPTVPTLRTFKKDLAECGIERVTAAGALVRKSTRKSFATWLTTLEVAPGVANMLMRHTRDVRERNYLERRQMIEPMRAALLRLVAWLREADETYH